MNILAIETSCDETSAAVVKDGALVSHWVSSQIGIHREYGGVVPELAVREHLKVWGPMVQSVLKEADVSLSEVELIAATRGPGLPSALRIGYHGAESLAFALEVPFMGIHHHEAHLYSSWIEGDPPRLALENFQPTIGLIVSGGHTLLVWIREPGVHEVIGATLDDAAGECFDKTAKLLGLNYPGGPEMDRLAKSGNPQRFDFPRPMIREDHLHFSFSGLKTAVRYFLERNPEVAEDEAQVPDLCASIQAAIVEVLVKKTLKAARDRKAKRVAVSGGVACNSFFRRELAAGCEANGLELGLAAPRFCTDNAGMVGLLAEDRYRRFGATTQLDLGILPSWPL